MLPQNCSERHPQLGKEVKIKFYYWRRASIRAHVVGVMAVKGRGFDSTWSLDDVVCVTVDNAPTADFRL